MDLIKALQLKALRNVMCDSSDRDYHLRYIFRWYSKTFFTPLHEVHALPVVDVLTAYFEERFEGFNEEELNQEKIRLIETEQERKEREAREAADRALEEEFVKQTEMAEQQRLESLKKPVAPLVEGARLAADKITEHQGSAGVIAQTGDTEPLIKIDFVDEKTFSEELEGFGNMTPPDDD